MIPGGNCAGRRILSGSANRSDGSTSRMPTLEQPLPHPRALSPSCSEPAPSCTCTTAAAQLQRGRIFCADCHLGMCRLTVLLQSPYLCRGLALALAAELGCELSALKVSSFADGVFQTPRCICCAMPLQHALCCAPAACVMALLHALCQTPGYVVLCPGCMLFSVPIEGCRAPRELRTA